MDIPLLKVNLKIPLESSTGLNGDYFQVFIALPYKTFSVVVCRHQQVKHLKEQLFQMTSVEPEKQCIKLHGRALLDESILSSCGVTPSSTLEFGRFH